MSQASPNLDLPFLLPSQAQKHVTHNEALRRLDLVVQLRLQQTGAIIPPAIAAEGEIHALGAGATGNWAGQDGKLAAWLEGSWTFILPQPGWQGWDAARAQPVIWDGGDWVTFRPDRLERLGIAADADATNRLAVSAPASLFSHDGSDHRLTVNKAAAGDTASLLLQSGWNGHAEMGLAGQNAFSIKVSPDGDSWTEALRLDEVTGRVSGAAVQADPVDASQGCLLTVGAFGLGETGLAPEIGDIAASDTPAGTYRYISGTAGTDSLPAGLGSYSGLIRIERFNGSRLRQTAWRNNLADGIWTRCRSSGEWGAWRQIFDHDTIVGTVSEASGQPTGAIIERGASADGEYVRFADGTQLCTRIFDSEQTSHAWSFPVPFAAAGNVTIQALPRHGSAPRIVTEAGDLNTTGVSLKVWDITGAAASAVVHASATGRWF